MNSAVNRILAKSLKLPTAGAVVKEFSAFVSFRYHQFARRPYFGLYMASRRLSPTRASFMRQLMQKICSERGSLLMLEIGSWAGESAILWGEVAKQTLRHEAPSTAVYHMVSIRGHRTISLDGNPHLGPMRKAALREKIFSLSSITSNRQADNFAPDLGSCRREIFPHGSF
jgi:hypothetical protein